MKRFTLMILGTVIAVAPALNAGSVEVATDKLAQIESRARQVRDNADTMQTFVRFPSLYTTQTHNRKLTLMREDVNALADILAELHQNRSDLAKWQSEVVNRLIPRADRLADEIDNAIRHIKENPGEDYVPAYEDYVDGAYSVSDSIVETVDTYLSWAEAKQKKQQISEVR